MKFPTLWIRLQNTSGTIAARGWSDVSLDEANRNAEDLLQRILAALRNKKKLDLDRYSCVIDNVIYRWLDKTRKTIRGPPDHAHPST